MLGVFYLSATKKTKKQKNNKKNRSKLGVDKIIIMSEDMSWERLSEPVAFKLRPESWKRIQLWYI